MPIHASLPQNLADHLTLLGGIAANRIIAQPSPGTATFDDWKAAHDQGVVCELVDGTLVEKPMGFYESLLAACLIRHFGIASDEGRLGLTSGEQGFIRLPNCDQVRGPDVAFFLWDRLPDRKVPTDLVPTIAPDIAVEVLSRSNTLAEMATKRKEYFAAGTQLVWLVDPASRSVAVYTSPLNCNVIDENGTLEGGEILPTLKISVAAMFAEVDGAANR
ncbi:MAG: Uma2 family endonuclease [Planctomycetota bacterium]